MNVHNGTVSFHQFCKAKIAPRQQFTFWNWFYDCCQVIGDKMLAYWENGYIMDFLTRDDSMGILSSSSHPAFLLRFSDSELGVLALSFFINNRNGTKTPYQCLLNEPHPDKAVTLVALLRDFSSLRNIRYICMKNQELKDKKIFFDDKDLADTAGESDNVTPNGYHKVRLSLALAVSGEDVTQQEDQNEDQVEPTQFGNTSPIEFFSSPQAPQAVGSTSSNGFPCHHQQQQNGTASGYEPINNGNILTSHNSPCWNE
uniref:SH2 domain-containing protein n=1 Tax=Plectus sambesii TaxID=2011161 RepID=A0A914XR77_9BILA